MAGEILKKPNKLSKSPLNDIKILKAGQLDTNCYLVYSTKFNSEGTQDAIIIDPADEPDYIFQEISSLNLKPLAILATHGHFDHILAAHELKINFQIPFYMNKKDEFLLSRMRQTSIHFTGFDPGPPPTVDANLEKVDALEISNIKFRVLHLPGHTPGSVAFYFPDDKSLFSGDLIFQDGGVGRTDFSYADEKLLTKSIDILSKLPQETIVYPGHEESFQLGVLTSHH
jgi:hydroxyacylglutathione hydrolase